MFKDRLLGASKIVEVPTVTFWLATGNNLQAMGDLTSRVLLCRLDAGVERPGERRFDVKLRDFVPQHRPALVAAVLTVLRGYIAAGQPEATRITQFGRFEEWSALVRGALIWLGLSDPLDSRLEIEDADPVRARLGRLLNAWHEVIGPAEVRVRDVLDRLKSLARPPDIPDARLPEAPDFVALREALQDVAGGPGGEISGQRLGQYLRRYRQRIEGGLRIEKMATDSHSKVERWRVCPLPNT
jgi:hypothetical protein